MEEPTFAALGFDPALFVKHFQSLGQPPDNPQEDTQRQLKAVQSTGSTHGQDKQNVGDGDGAVSGDVGQPLRHGEGSGVSGTAGVAAPDDVNMDLTDI